MAEWAEELGFDSFWLGEHHFYWYGTRARTLEPTSTEIFPKFK
jgi:alkanesulfonate monooxygenase SsuD/methylene tetrahydromethanopterin reductase-like flavin-dependent oxidoreductase (luciferase family)